MGIVSCILHNVVTTAVNGSSINRTSSNRRDNAADSCDSTATFKPFIKLTGARKVHRLAMDFGALVTAFCKSCVGFLSLRFFEMTYADFRLDTFEVI